MSAMEDVELGDCFEVAGAMVVASDDLILCHGLVWHPVTGYHWHAWAERGEMFAWPDDPRYAVPMTVCIDHANGNEAELPGALYYAVGKIETVHKYKRGQAIEHMIDSGHFGPWVDEEGYP